MINKGHEFGTSQRADRLKRSFISLLWLVLGLVIIPLLYITGVISIETVNKLGRYMTYALVAVGLDLIWGMLASWDYAKPCSSVLADMPWECI